MSMFMSQFYGKKYLSWIGGTAEAPPLSLTARLFTVAPTEAGGGVEVVGGGYAPQTVSLGTPVNGTGGLTAQVLNDLTFTFINVLTAGEDIAAYALYDQDDVLVLCNNAPDPLVFDWPAGANPQVSLGQLLLGTTK